MQKRFKAGEIILLSVVPLALIVIGYVLMRRPVKKVAAGPHRLVFKGTKRVQLSPLLAFQGYDTALDLYIGCAGDKPKDWGEQRCWSWTSQNGDIESDHWVKELDRLENDSFPSAIGSGLPRFDEEKQAYVIPVYFKLRKYPKSAGALRWCVNLRESDFNNKRLAGLPITLALRTSGEIIPKPAVSHYCPLSLTAYHSWYYGSGRQKYFQIETNLRLNDDQIDGEKASLYFIGQVILVDKKGRHHNFWVGNGTITPARQFDSVKRFYVVRLDQTPAVPNVVRVRFYLALNDTWPVLVDIDLRTKSPGKFESVL